MKFVLLTQTLADQIAAWFDDSETIRYLGGRDWLYRELALMQTAPMTTFRGRQILGRYVWVVEAEGQVCALVDIEPYDDGTAGMALVVAPEARGQGVGQRVLLAVETRPELNGVRKMIGAVEPENILARRCYERAGYGIAEAVDEEGFLRIEKQIDKEG